MKLVKNGDKIVWEHAKPEVFKPNDPTIGYAGEVPYWWPGSWSAEYSGYTQFYAAKPTRKQLRKLVDYVNTKGLPQ